MSQQEQVNFLVKLFFIPIALLATLFMFSVLPWGDLGRMITPKGTYVSSVDHRNNPSYNNGSSAISSSSSSSSSYSSQPSFSGSVLTGNYRDSWHDTAKDDTDARRRGFVNAEQERGVYMEAGKRMLAEGYSLEEVKAAMLVHVFSH